MSRIAKAAPTIDPKTLALYEKLVATIPGVERKGASMPYTARNGHMFSFLTKEGVLALRLPADARETFLKRHKTKPVIQHGVEVEDYVQVPAPLLEKTRELKPFFDQSYAYVGSLKPKATKR